MERPPTRSGSNTADTTLSAKETPASAAAAKPGMECRRSNKTYSSKQTRLSTPLSVLNVAFSNEEL